MKTKCGKIIYVLGAGASAASGLPVQTGLLRDIFASKQSLVKALDVSFLASNETDMLLYSGLNDFYKSRQKVADFLLCHFAKEEVRSKYLSLSSRGLLTQTDTEWEAFFEYLKNLTIPLEDVFTLVDRSILAGEDVGTNKSTDMHNIKDDLYKCIIFALSLDIYKAACNNTMKTFAKKVLDIRCARKLSDDPVSILTLNWDTLLDRAIDSVCRSYNNNHKKNLVFRDYCFYDYPSDDKVPSTLIKSNKNYNIKLLKLHGSINWIHCNNCGRVFTDTTHDLSLKLLGPDEPECPFCIQADKKHSFSPLIITPTLLKDYSSLAIKNIWQNAHIDVSEADEIIFIGYSFPMADFEFRYLLKRALKPSTKIKVILTQNSNPDSIKAKLIPLPDNDKKTIFRLIQNNSPQQRYLEFFANHEITFYYDGMVKAMRDGFF